MLGGVGASPLQVSGGISTLQAKAACVSKAHLDGRANSNSNTSHTNTNSDNNDNNSNSSDMNSNSNDNDGAQGSPRWSACRRLSLLVIFIP